MQEHERETRYERKDLPARSLAVAIFIVILLVVVTAIVGWITRQGFQASRARQLPPPRPLAERRVPPPPPRLQEAPRVDMREMAEQQRELLNRYGVVDAEQGVYRIPIDRAMEITARRLADADAAPAPDEAPDGEDSQ